MKRWEDYKCHGERKTGVAPPVKPMPERIDATPEDIAERFLSLPADYQWQYEQDEKTEPTQPA